MITTLIRIIKYGFLSFRRNGLISVATIIVMTLALLVFQSLIIFNVLTNTALTSLRDKIDVSIYFKANVLEDDILKLSRAIETLDEVKTVEYISRDKALEIFKERHKDDTTISQALEEVEENPLLASLNIKAHDTNDYRIILSYLNNEEFKDLIEKGIADPDREKAIDRLNTIVSTAERVGLGATIFLTLTAILVTFNTIRLAIYSNREEISIMRLVGASNLFINGPYIIESIIFGVVAAIASIILSMPFIALAAPYVASFVPEMNLTTYFYSNIFNLFLYQLIFSMVIGIVSGTIAIRRYLKV